MSDLLKSIFLKISNNYMLTKLSKRYGPRFGAQRFVVGMNMKESLVKIRKLNEGGLSVTLDHLGEFIHDEKEVMERTNEIINCIQIINKEGIDAEVSLKLTSLGMDQSIELALRNMRLILDVAARLKVTVTIDMENHSRIDKTLEVFKTLKIEYENIGTVLQAYLYRSLKDLEHLNRYTPYLRIVKGAYLESSEVAFPSKADVDENYRNLIKLNLLYGNYTAIGTHDDSIIRYVQQLEDTHRIKRSQFEFQMLYGIRTELQKDLQKSGYKVRVYVPYGRDWFGYNMRRLAERPANLWFVFRNIFKR